MSPTATNQKSTSKTRTRTKLSTDLALNEQAYVHIRTDIIRCTLPPGTEFSEAQLERKYRLGLAAIRKALSRLTQDGLVKPLPRRGYLIVPITLQSIHDMMELRLLLEPATAKRAALSAGDTSAIQEAAAEPYDATISHEDMAFVAANRRFHLGIAKLAGNELIVQILDGLMDSMERLLHLALFSQPDALTREDKALQRKQHDDLLQAILSHEPERAAKIAQEHIICSKDVIMKATTSGRTSIRL